jgi:hypothetical protein
MCCVTDANTDRSEIEKAVRGVHSQTAKNKNATSLDYRCDLHSPQVSDCVSDKKCAPLVLLTRPIRHRTPGGPVRGTN